MNDSRKSLLYALISVLCWSTVATAFKFTLSGMNYVQLLFYASLASSLILLSVARKISASTFPNIFSYKYLMKNVLSGLLNPFIYYMVLFKAYSLLPAQEAQPLNYTWPIVISIFSVIFLKSKFSKLTFAGLALAFTGVVVIATRGDITSFGFENPLGVFLAVSSSVIWASFWIINLKDKRESIEKLAGSFFYGTVISFFYILFFDSFDLKDPVYLFGAVYIGIFEMGITFYFWMKALQLSPNKAKTSTFAFLSPFISLVFIALFLGEHIRISSVTGLILIVGGILIQNLPASKTSPVKQNV